MPGLAFAAATSLLGASFVTCPYAQAQGLTDAQLNEVKDNLWLAAQQTWEIGTEAQALVESDAPAYAVFADASLPPPTGNSSSSYNYTALQPVLQIAYNTAYNRSNMTGPQPLMYVERGAAGDPASIGVAMLIANWTGTPEPELDRPVRVDSPYGTSVGQGVTYARAAEEQLEYLLTVVPRTSDGAISHRVETTQLWSDSVYMIPPFLAYYGVLSGNQSLVQEAYNQVKLYRSYLYNSSESLWQHILLGTGAYDPGYWSTGNGWAAAGMVRVLATIQHSQFADTMVSEMKDLSTWIVEIHTGMYSRQDASTSLFHNYANNATWFLDSSSTALLASTVYRLAALQGVYTHIPHAEAARAALSASAPAGESEYTAWGTGDGVGPATSFTQTTATATSAPASRSGTATTSYAMPTPAGGGLGEGLSHFSPQMWVTPVVDPYNWNAQGGSSPEGQAFVVEMYAAWRDWVELGSPGASDSRRSVNELVRGASGGVLGRVAKTWRRRQHHGL